MREDAASRTAMRVALQRAAHQLLDTPLVFEDRLAVTILGGGAEQALRSAADDYRTPLALGVRGCVVARSRLCSDALAAAIARGTRQVVVLGAGLDTTAYGGVLPADVKVYEVDHPATQAWKKEMLRAAGIPVPASVAFVPIDFDKATLTDGLHAGRVQLSQPIFFSWLGVVFYLPAEAVLTTLREIGSLRAGGEIVFDYFEPPQKFDAAKLPGFDAFGTQAAAGGEPWKSYFEPADMASALRASGFPGFEDFDSGTLAARYFANRSDGLRPTIPSRFVRAQFGA